MADDCEKLKAVVHLVGRKLIKGHYHDRYGVVRDAQTLTSLALPPQMELETLSGENVCVGLEAAKAIFFVREFDGRPAYEELTFFKGKPEMAGLWVRLRFFDDEVVEGLVHNSLSFVTSSGFFLKPTDPSSNNYLVYALKESLAGFEVLGMRADY